MKCINLYLSFKWNKELSLFIALLIMSLFYNYQHVFQQGPYSIHMWRQTDCLAITQGYYHDNANLLEPSMSYQVGGTGRCVSEFPLFYYINAQVWKLVGKSEFLFRLFTFSIVMIGLLFLYWLIRAVLKSHFWAMGLTLFVFTSPVFVFYANSFMGNVPAVSMVFIAWYFFYKFHSDSSHDTYLIGCALIILLVGLIRISLLYTFSFIYLIYVIELFTSYRFGIDRKLFERKIKQVVILATPILIILSWVVYATHYNTINHSEGLFLVNLRPIWVMERADLLETTRMLFYYNNLPTLLFSFVGVLLFIGCSAFLLYHVNKLNKIVQLILYSLFIGCSLYVLFFYASFRVHDYYYLELIPLLFAVFGVFVYTIKMNWPVVYMSRNFKIGFLLFLLLSSVYCAAKHRIRYVSDEFFVKASSRLFLYRETERDSWNWFHWDYSVHLKALENIEPQLRSIGIQKNDLVLSLPDPSPNITLYMMGQKGYTNFYRGDLNLKDKVLAAQKDGVKYLVVTHHEVLEDAGLKAILNAPIAVFDNVYIFDVTDLTQ